MKAVVAQWAQWNAKFAALTRRERGITAAVLVLGGGLLIFNFAVEPFMLKARSAVRAEATARAELARQQAQVAALAAQNVDPDAVNRRRLAQVKQELAADFEAGMVPPARMQAFLQGLLARNRAIELLELKTQPVTLVGASPRIEIQAGTSLPAARDAGKDKAAQEAADSGSGDGIYQHGIEIRLAGDYNSLLNYLAELERMPQRLLWNSVRFTVEKYPRNIMVVRVYTLSLDRNWLVV